MEERQGAMTKKNRLLLIFLFILLVSPVWFFLRGNKGFIELPVQFGSFSTPFIDVMIDSNKYPLLVDLGSQSELSLNPDILQSLEKSFHDKDLFKDVKGREYPTTTYLIPQVVLGNLSFADVKVKEDVSEFHKNNNISVPIEGYNPLGLSSKTGSIGLYLLNKINMLLDFPNAKILLTNDLKKVLSSDEEWIKVPLDTESWIILTIETDFGPKKFVLDTGATVTHIRSSSFPNAEWQKGELEIPFLPTSRFIIGGKDFGSYKLYTSDIGPWITQFDGILGMDFLKDHTIYIDFTHQMLMIKPS